MTIRHFTRVLCLCQFALSVFHFACTPAPQPLPQLTPPGWQDGETAVYQVIRNDSVLFIRTTTLRYDEESGTPVLLFTNVVRTESAPFYFFDSTTFVLTRFTLLPVWSYRTVATEISISEVEVEFKSERVELRKETVDGIEEKSFPANKKTFGIEMLPQLFRTIPLEPGISFQVNAIVGLEFRTIPVTVKVLGTKNVNAPIGNILCREVEALAPQRNLRLLYELADPHRLIAIRDIENSTESILVDFTVLETESLPPEE